MEFDTAKGALSYPAMTTLRVGIPLMGIGGEIVQKCRWRPRNSNFHYRWDHFGSVAFNGIALPVATERREY
jgi:hypothetical protein